MTASAGTSAPSGPGSVDARGGTAFGAAAYAIWGVFPLFFHALRRAGAIEIVVHRVLWTVVVCAVLLAATRDLSWVRRMLHAPRRVLLLGLAAAALAANWGIYIYGVNSGQVVETALGYFINPLVTVLFGVVLLRERLNRLQWVAVGLGAASVMVLTVDYGHPPWIAISLAVSFASYGLVKKRVGADVGAVAGLTTETALLAPVAVAGLIWLEVTGRGTFSLGTPWHGLLLISTGLVTAVPLLMFAAAARRVPLVMMGLLQFITPALQLLCGVLLLGEQVPTTRWVGFGIVWLALVLLAVDSVRSSRQRARRGPAPDATILPGAASVRASSGPATS